MEINLRNFGGILVGLSLILLFLLVVVKINVDKEESYLCEITHETNRDINQCPAHESNNSWLILLAFGAIFLILGSGIYSIFMPAVLPKAKELKVQEFRHVDVSKLEDDEKKIYDLLKQSDGSIYQSDIIKELCISKVRATRILDKMESRRIIERKRRGMTNIVVLK